MAPSESEGEVIPAWVWQLIVYALGALAVLGVIVVFVLLFAICFPAAARDALASEEEWEQ